MRRAQVWAISSRPLKAGLKSFDATRRSKALTTVAASLEGVRFSVRHQTPAIDLDSRVLFAAPAALINTREIGGIYDEGIQGPDHRRQFSRYLHGRGWSDTSSHSQVPAGANRAIRTGTAGG
jgi:hypothetical protein